MWSGIPYSPPPSLNLFYSNQWGGGAWGLLHLVRQPGFINGREGAKQGSGATKRGVWKPPSQGREILENVCIKTAFACLLNDISMLHMWPCITKPTKSRIAQFCVMAKNRWSGSAKVIFIFYIFWKSNPHSTYSWSLEAIKRIISRVFAVFSRPIFLRSDGSCDHSTCPFISL